MGRKEKMLLPPSRIPDPETFKLATNDFLSPAMFVQYCMYFRAPDLDPDPASDKRVELLASALQEDLSQARPLVGHIEERGGEFYIVVGHDSTVAFTIHDLTKDADGSPVPTFDELEAASFTSTTLGDIGLLCLEEMDQGLGKASPEHKPPVLGVQVNVLRGGLAVTVHFHHWALAFSGFASLMRLWAENTRATEAGTPCPELDPACLDRSRVNARLPLPSEETEQSRPHPNIPTNQPAHLPINLLLFHLALTKASHLKTLARQSSPDSPISTYDTFTALWWRLLTRHRAQTYHLSAAELDMPAPFFEVLDMRSRLRPAMPKRFLGNALMLAGSGGSDGQGLTVRQVMTSPLGVLAGHILSVTRRVDEEAYYKSLAGIETRRQREMIQPSPSKSRAKARPLMALKTTDWRGRDVDVCRAEFGGGLRRSTAFRQLFRGEVAPSNVYIYPPRLVDGEEVYEFVVPVEKVAVERFRGDAEVQEWFGYRGVEWVGEG